jgi:cytochrome P450
MFSLGSNKPHSIRKRMLSNIYSKSVVNASPALVAQISEILYRRFLPFLSSVCSQSSDPGVFNVMSFLNGATMDIVTGYIFGLTSSSDLISNPEELDWFLDLYNSRRSFNFWPQEYPRLTMALYSVGIRLFPKWVEEANDKIEAWTEKMCRSAADVMQKGNCDVADTPVVYQQLAAALSKETKKTGGEERDMTFEIGSEVMDHLAAGFDTSGITLTYVVHELSKNPDVQARLQAELRTLSPPLVPSSAPTLPEPKVVDSLPFLHAVIWETLRLRSAIPGPQPRATPPQGCRLGPDSQNYYVPGGVRVSASAGLLHLNEEVYERAEEWRPERWLEDVSDEKKKDMESRWFWAFGRLVFTVFECNMMLRTLE